MMFLLLVVMFLGVLAFFEPCTIATHTLFSARAHKKDRLAKWSDLFQIWLVRGLTVSFLFVAATLFTHKPMINPVVASGVLVLMALVYLVSRQFYLPIPHLKVYRFLPFSSQFSDGVKLGLTLPACTLPLMVIMTVLVIRLNAVPVAILAGFVFATFFTLPILVTTLTGIGDKGKTFLSTAANVSTHVTAFLLLAAALYLIYPVVDISDFALENTFKQASWAGIGLAFMAGLVFSFNPVSFASIPVMLVYVTRSSDKNKALSLAGAFIAGLVITHVSLGVIAALGGDWVKGLLGRQWGLFLGPILIVLGLMWAGWLRLKLPWFSMKGKKVSGHWGAFLLSIPFSVAICPFCAPALLIALTASSIIGSVWFGAGLLLSFAIGRSIPIIIGAWSMSWLERLQSVAKYHHAFEVIGGVVMILSGLYLLNEYFYVLPSLTLMATS